MKCPRCGSDDSERAIVPKNGLEEKRHFFLLVKKWLESRAPEDKSFMTMLPVPF